MKISTVRRFALSLPEATEQPHFHFTSFRIRGKMFATVPPDQDYLHVFVDEAVREQALAIHPEWSEKLWWGKRVVGLQINLSLATAAAVKDLLQSAWRRKAPKGLAETEI